ncbi:MAG: hypothetical protein JSU63_22085 [Phycisphaerales bacterium]|nr:MAG: hypothetical protein JSU63_22085 [Phycisphaerales bacterium]
MIDEDLRAWAQARGLEVACGPIDVVAEVWSELDTRRQGGELDAEFDREWMNWFRYPEGLPIDQANSVIVIVLPRPAHTVTFALEGGPLETVVPPTYVDYSKRRKEVHRDLASSVFQGQHQLKILLAPLKAVAARLGLVRYGLNNITYSPSFGSYIQLVGFVTDTQLAQTDEATSSTVEVLPTCRTCSTCQGECPTGAIGEDRFLLHTERCLTLHSEAAGAWPDYIVPSAHHCLIGCMRCQEVCPENAGLLRTESSGLAFSADETAAILRHDESTEAPANPSVVARLETVGLEDYAPMLGRNLRALVK